MQLSFTLSPQNPIRLLAIFLLILSPFSSYATRSSNSSLLCSSSKHVDNCFTPKIVKVMDSLQRQVAFRSWGNDSITSPLPKVHALAQCHDDLSSLDCRKSRSHIVSLQILLVWKHYKVKTITDMIDPGLKDSFPEKQAETVLQIGLLCTQASPRLRPFMNEVVSLLAKARSEIPSPKQPPFLNASVLRVCLVLR
ncbi:hypothetical protein D5086_028369 [Populus alba]|uniref:Uncharacterized protein n=1 Tax=Populus alba TaxID=43335 RepID=A0ACC4AXZ5_POPAL